METATLRRNRLTIAKSMNVMTFGERAFANYLDGCQISYEYEPALPKIPQLFDFVIDHPTHGKILLDVKDIEVGMFGDSPCVATFDPYLPIRKHIDAGRQKFKAASDYVNGLVLVAAPNCHVDLLTPYVVLGSMYGDYGFSIPFNPELGHHDASAISKEFIVGRGKMVQKNGPHRNTRIAALITLHNFSLWNYAMQQFLNRDNGQSREERFEQILTEPLPFQQRMQLG